MLSNLTSQDMKKIKKKQIKPCRAILRPLEYKQIMVLDKLEDIDKMANLAGDIRNQVKKDYNLKT